MRVLLLSISIIVVLSGCSKQQPRQASTADVDLTKICPIYARHEKPDGSLEPFPFIRPEHIASITPTKPWYKGESAAWVELTDIGAERMYRETKDAVGTRIAFFCGNKELERATLQGSIKKGFRLTLPEKSPNNSVRRLLSTPGA
jgi:preprotein translocase subunit SecD